LLVFPVGHGSEVEVLPGQTVDTWDAAKWFVGEGPPPAPNQEFGTEDPRFWRVGARPIALFRSHDRLVRQWHEERARLQNIADDPASATVGSLEEASMLLVSVQAVLQDVRQNMRFVGIVPPTLPRELQHIDQEAEDNPGGAT